MRPGFSIYTAIYVFIYFIVYFSVIFIFAMILLFFLKRLREYCWENIEESQQNLIKILEKCLEIIQTKLPAGKDSRALTAILLGSITKLEQAGSLRLAPHTTASSVFSRTAAADPVFWFKTLN